MKKSLKPYLALVTGILALSMSGIFVRLANAPGVVTSFYRMFIASMIMLPFFWNYVRKHRNSALNWHYLWLPLLGGIFTGLDHYTWSTAIGYTRIANATLMNYIAPLWVALFAHFLWKQQLKQRFWIGLVLTLCGIFAIFGNDMLTAPQLGMGDLLAIFSSLFYAGYFLITQRGREYFQTLPYVWVVALGSAVTLLIIVFLSGHPLAGYPLKTYLAFLGAALLSQVIGYFSVGYALGHISAAVVAPTMLASPVLAALLAIPLTGETLAPVQYLGGLISLSGIYLINRHTAN
ncbi:MAG: DMT family transporter [Anaerolineales bacterium]